MLADLAQCVGDGPLRDLRWRALLGPLHRPDTGCRVAQRVLVDDRLHHAEDATLVRLVDAHGLVIVVARREPLRPVLVLEVGLDGRAAVVVGHDDLARARHVLRPHQQAVALVEVVVAHAVALDDDQPAFARYVLHRDRSRLVGVVAVLVGNARPHAAVHRHLDHGSPDNSGGEFFNSIENLYLCTMNNQGLLALAQLILPSEILSNFEVVRVEEEASLIRIYLDESVKAEYKENPEIESKGFCEAVTIRDFPIRDKGVDLIVRRRKWYDKQNNRYFSDFYDLKAEETRYSKEFAAFLKGVYGDDSYDLPFA